MSLAHRNETTVYFCTNIVTTTAFDHQEKTIQHMYTRRLSQRVHVELDIKCPDCNYSTDCDRNAFDFKLLVHSIKIKVNVALSESQQSIETTQSPSYFFHTQRDAGQEVGHVRNRSILECLQNIGYYGLATFVATVQRIDSIQSPSSSQFLSMPTQTQHREPLQKQLIVSDKANMLALILVPGDMDVLESYEYRFKSFKFVGKRPLPEGYLI